MSYFLFFFFLLLCNCSEKQDLKNEKRNLQISPSVESDDYNNIRIEFDTNCLSLSEINEPIFNNALNKAKETIQRIVKVKNLQNNIDMSIMELKKDLIFPKNLKIAI